MTGPGRVGRGAAGHDVPVRDAATVVLLRDGADGVEAWLLSRVSGMAFAAGMTVFPGGRVDDDDARLPGTSAVDAATAARLGCSLELARALLGAAVRETFEESAVLLTVPPAQLADRRADVETGRIGFGALLQAHQLRVDGAALHPWARWITPVGEPRRYDTRFFLAALPDGAQAEEGTTESSAAGWVGIGAALEQVQRGQRKALPPTLATLASLAGFATVAEALAAAAARPLAPVQPTIRIAEDGAVIADLGDGSSVRLPWTARR